MLQLGTRKPGKITMRTQGQDVLATWQHYRNGPQIISCARTVIRNYVLLSPPSFTRKKGIGLSRRRNGSFSTRTQNRRSSSAFRRRYHASCWIGKSRASMNARFYVYKNDETLGPYTREEIDVRLSSGAFKHEDLFWCEGMGGRVPLSKMNKLEQSQPPPIPAKPPLIPTRQQISPEHARSSVTIDKLLMIGGAIFLFYFYMVFDPSVATEAGYRVNNLGLMQDRTMGCVISVGAIITGAVLRDSRKKLSRKTTS